MDKLINLKTFEDACKVLKLDYEKVIPDFTDSNQCKYEAWFDLSEGSSGFRYDVYDFWFALSFVGSRLCFISREVCNFIVKQFIEIYKEYFL